MTQWHPLFAQLLRPVVESHYEVETNVPVGDVPREADIVLLRRTSEAPSPFSGLWKHLTTWNILEFKGPTVSPRIRDLDLLVELGLGIDRRLNEERRKQRQKPVDPRQVSFWYLASRLGKRFLREAAARLGPLEPCGAGIWRCPVLLRLVYLVSSVDLPVERDSVPLHIAGLEPARAELEVARLVVEHEELWQSYAPWLKVLYPTTWKEVETMARTARRGPIIHFEPFVESLGLQGAIEEMARTVGKFETKDRQVDVRPLIKIFGAKRFRDALNEEERREREQGNE